MALALGAVARAGNVSQLARDAGMTREGVYKALSADGDPSFATITKIAHAPGCGCVLRRRRMAGRPRVGAHLARPYPPGFQRQPTNPNGARVWVHATHSTVLAVRLAKDARLLGSVGQIVEVGELKKYGK